MMFSWAPSRQLEQSSSTASACSFKLSGWGRIAAIKVSPIGVILKCGVSKMLWSNHVATARKMYDVENVLPSKNLSRKTGCSVNALNRIVKKGMGAYFSSGSRPNQTAQSWGIARLASALTSGKAGAVDYNILNNGCKNGSKGYKAAQLARKKYGYGHSKTKKIKILDK